MLWSPPFLYYVWAQHQRARELAEEALDLAQQTGDPLLVAVAHSYLGFILFALGEYTAARAHLQQMIAFYSPEQHLGSLISLRGSDVGLRALAYDACCLWCLGYPDQAAERGEEALAMQGHLEDGIAEMQKGLERKQWESKQCYQT